MSESGQLDRWTQLLDAVATAQAQFDQRVVAERRQVIAQGVPVYCEAGCGGCCTLAVNCSFVEAADESARCQVYAARPISCRALLATRPPAWCSVDFSTLHPLEKQAFLSGLARDLVNFPTHYLAAPQESGAQAEAELNARCRDLFGIALSGNMLYQIWLEQTYHLSEVIIRGAEATRRFIAEENLASAYLLHF